MVRVRSYSCISGMISEEIETGTPGMICPASSRMRRSCSPLAKALISETVSASTPCDLSCWSACRAELSFSRSITSPRAPTRSSTSTVMSSGARGSGMFHTMKAARPPGTKERPIWSTWRYPFVVTRPILAPLPSRMAFVATVVPCITWPMFRGSTPASEQTFEMPFSTPIEESAGVEGTLARNVSPFSSSMSSRSVNVPPTSTPRRYIESLLPD